MATVWSTVVVQNELLQSVHKSAIVVGVLDLSHGFLESTIESLDRSVGLWVIRSTRDKSYAILFAELDERSCTELEV